MTVGNCTGSWRKGDPNYVAAVKALQSHWEKIYVSNVLVDFLEIISGRMLKGKGLPLTVPNEVQIGRQD